VKRKITLLAAVVCLWLAGCRADDAMKDISTIAYSSDVGSILPEMQWHEEVTISRDRISFTRNGRVPGTQVNEGNWEFAADETQVIALFTVLQAVNCTSLQRIEPEDAPDGGGRESYTITYANGKTCSLSFDPGVTYTNGERITVPVQTFLQTLDLPAEAQSRYVMPSS
jgi:hypothetical protein